MTTNVGYDTNPNGAELQFLPSITMDGALGYLGHYDKLTGGDATANVQKHRPGGMGPEVAYLALPVYSVLTVSRVYEEARDHALIGTLRTLAGSTYGTITMQPLDAQGNPWGNPTVYRGRLTAVKSGNADSTSSTPRMYDLDFEIESIGN